MLNSKVAEGNVIYLPQPRKSKDKARKDGLNRNKEGSVRRINGKVYVDFVYLDERVRESSGLDWNDKNARQVREQLDKIIVAIKSGTFRFAEVFPNSQKLDFFAAKEREVYRLRETPEQVPCGEFFSTWYDLLRNSGRVTGRTLLGYKGYMNLYLVPFFGEMKFGELNAVTFERFISWARQRQYNGEPIQNQTINKCLTVLKMVCKTAAISFGWGGAYSPFFGFKKLPETDAYEDISPFSPVEQRSLIDCLAEHWRPYFRFAFCAGLRPGEQIALKPEDVDWEKGLLHIRRAVTLDENGKKTLGTTKNRYSRRTIRLLPVMMEALSTQKAVYDKFRGHYFFCTATGAQIDLNNLRDRVWTPALRKAGLVRREMKQTRHSFATIALSCGENPLWIARVMGHRNTEMIIRVYGKFIENARGCQDGGLLNGALQDQR
jgi:integrase